MKTVENAKRIVFKVGTSTLTHANGKLNLRRVEELCAVLSDLKNMGKDIVLVTSGAIAAGVAKLGLPKRPGTTPGKQAAAAVGQSELMRMYAHYFSMFGHNVGQILLTRDETDKSAVWHNASNTFNTLIEMDCIPIVNENDSLSFAEIEFGDNDTLSAVVAKICRADALVLLSDIDGLYDADPRKNKDAKLISRVGKITDEIMSFAGGAGTENGTGGLITKLHAAKITSEAGIPMYLMNGENPKLIYDLIEKGNIGTFFEAEED